MPRLPHSLAALASACLLAAAVASPRSPVERAEPFDEPVTCPFCGGRFTIESFTVELGGQLMLRTVRLLTGQ